MKRTLNFSVLAGLVLLLVFAVPAVSAYGSFEISGTYTDDGVKWLNDHWGENITLGQLAKIAYAPEDYSKINENVDPKVLERVWSQPYYWGDRYPPHAGTNTATAEAGAKTTGKAGADAAVNSGTTTNRFFPAIVGGISLTATPTGYSGGYITFGGSGTIYGYYDQRVDSFRVEANLYGDSTKLSTSYTERYSFTNTREPHVILSTSGIRTPVRGTLYQAQIIGQSTNPTFSANTWSSAYLYS
ncbi:MAG: hypothetical protein WC342_06445 [Methanoregula sp.]|jgi:hypothetical protein